MEKAISAKTQDTRTRILEVAHELFLEHGFEKTTMRRIAQKAHLAPGAAYYYFKSKDHIVFYYYEQAYDEHLPGAREILRKKRSLQSRIAGVIKAHLDVAQPYQPIARALFKTASNPRHPLSPFSDESTKLRQKNIELFREALSGSNKKLSKMLLEHVPDMLWMYKMGVIFYWIFDNSPSTEKTYRLIDKTTSLIVKLIKISNLPIVRGFAMQMMRVFQEFKPYD